MSPLDRTLSERQTPGPTTGQYIAGAIGLLVVLALVVGALALLWPGLSEAFAALLGGAR